MATLGKAIALAAHGHEDQVDKGGKAYILHPIYVMMELNTDDEELMIIAILHDWVEDCNKSIIEGLTELRRLGFSERVIAGVDAVTRRPGEDYDDFIRRCAQNPDGPPVKRVDLKHNSNITRLKGLRKKDFDRLAKYARAYEYLRGL